MLFPVWRAFGLFRLFQRVLLGIPSDRMIMVNLPKKVVLSCAWRKVLSAIQLHGSLSYLVTAMFLFTAVCKFESDW